MNRYLRDGLTVLGFILAPAIVTNPASYYGAKSGLNKVERTQGVEMSRPTALAVERAIDTPIEYIYFYGEKKAARDYLKRVK